MILQPQSNKTLGLQVQKFIGRRSARPAHPHKKQLNARIIASLIGCIVLVVSSTTYFSYRYVRRLILENLHKNALLTVRHSADELDGWLATRQAEIAAIANSATVRRMKAAEILPYLRSEQERLDRFVAIAWQGPEGFLYATSEKHQSQFPNLRQDLQQALGPLFPAEKEARTKVVGSERIAIAAKVRSSDPNRDLLASAIAGLLDARPIASILDPLDYGEGSYALALDKQGLPLVRHNPSQLDNPDLLRKLGAEVGFRHQGIYPLTLNGKNYSVVYSPLARVDGSIALVIPQERLEAKLMGLNFLAIAIGVLLAAIAVVALRLVLTSEQARAFAAQEALLNRLTGRIRASLDLEEIVPTTVEELAKLLDLEAAAFGWYDLQKLSVEAWWEYSQKPTAGERSCLKLDSNSTPPVPANLQPHGNAQQRWFIPVPTEDESQGYLVLMKNVPWMPTQGEKELLQGVAGQLAIAITQSQLYVQTQQQVKRLAQALDRAALVAITDGQGTISHANEAFCQLSQYDREELIGKNYQILKLRNRSPKILREIYATLAQGQVWKGELNLCGKNGQDAWLDTTIFPFLNAKGISPQYLAVFFDITQRKRAEEQLRHAAFFDKLTGLPNRTLLMKHLEASLQRVQQEGEVQFALLFLDLDRFKVINDSLGHLIGDRLLVEVARRLKTCLGPLDTVTRFGGDEFIILLDRIDKLSDATRIAAAIGDSLQAPYNLSGYEVFTTASIGIVLSSNGYRNPEEVMRDADLAMYRAKAHHRGSYAVFDRQMHEEALNLLQLERDLRQALDCGQEFQLHYQPIIDLRGDRIVGFEALVRWQHPVRGQISPGLFIPIAEETQLITLLGEWVLLEACRQLREWQHQFPTQAPLRLNVNLSGVQLVQSDLMERIDRILASTGLSGQNLKLEITETVMMENLDWAKTLFEQLRRRQIQLSIDDFGTGYSSLSYLSSLPIDTLKIDRSFVQRMNCDRENLKIVEAIVALARNLSMDVVAEGIETEAQFAQLQALGCEYGQGYYFSRPLSGEAATELLAGTFGNNN